MARTEKKKEERRFEKASFIYLTRPMLLPFVVFVVFFVSFQTLNCGHILSMRDGKVNCGGVCAYGPGKGGQD